MADAAEAWITVDEDDNTTTLPGERVSLHNVEPELSDNPVGQRYWFSSIARVFLSEEDADAICETLIGETPQAGCCVRLHIRRHVRRP